MVSHSQQCLCPAFLLTCCIQIDDRLTFQWYQFLNQGLSVLGTIALVIYTYTYLGIIFIPLSMLYYVFA